MSTIPGTCCTNTGRFQLPSMPRRVVSTRRSRTRIQAGSRRYRIHLSDDDMSRQREVITFLTADGMVRLQGRILDSSTTKAAQLRAKLQQLPQPAEQGLCIGNVFTVAAMNACDPGRRINLQGFCRSVDLVSEAVEDVVVRAGGEVIVTECNLKHGLHESLTMTVAIPYLFGVPPLYQHLSSAIEMGGGYVDRVVKEWRIMP